MIVRITATVFFISSCFLWAESSSIPSSKRFLTKAINSVHAHPKISTDVKSLPPAVHPPLLIGSFNVQTLTKKKFQKAHVMDIVEQVIHRYDLILILEIHTIDDFYTKRLLMNLNRDIPPGEAYSMVLSEKKNETTEHYAIYYKTNKLRLIASESYDDPSVFYRKPLVAIFEAFTLRDMKKFGVVGQHVKPSNAVKEIDGLAGVYDYVKDTYEIEDVILMGDFNADCTYVKESDWENIALWNRPEFTWAITSKTDTTTNYKSCALDRFVYAGEYMNDGIILSSARAFDFQEAFDLDTDETREISDHLPIELKIRGKTSEETEKHLKAKLCFSVQDSRPAFNMSFKNISDIAKKAFFSATQLENGILLNNGTRLEEDMLTALKKIRNFLPSVMSYEVEEAIKYKVNHGSLRDDSSFSDVNDSRYILNVISSKEYVEVFVCRTTTIN